MLLAKRSLVRILGSGSLATRRVDAPSCQRMGLGCARRSLDRSGVRRPARCRVVRRRRPANDCFAAGCVALWLVIPGVTQLLGVAALFAPALIVCALVLAGWEQVAKLWHGRGDESKVATPTGPGS
jgi:hypothetical protein